MARKTIIERTEAKLQKLHEDADCKRLKLAMSYLSSAQVIITDPFYSDETEKVTMDITDKIRTIINSIDTILNLKFPA